MAGLPAARLPDLATCTNRYRGSFCRLPLTEPTRAATSHEVDTQSAVLTALSTGVGPMLDQQISAGDWFGHLRSLVALVRRAEADVEHRTTLNHSRGPDSAEEATRLLSVCVPALLSGEMPGVVAVLARSEAFPDELRAVGLPGPLVANWTRNTGRRTRAVVGAAALRRKAVPLPSACIPQLIPLELYERFIKDQLPGTAPYTGRAFAALAVARLVGARTWKEAGSVIEIPATRSVRLADVGGRRVTDTSEFWDRVHRVAAELGEQHVDYASRRRFCLNLDSVPASEWDRIARHHRVMVTEAGRRNAALWIWEHVAAGHPRHRGGIGHNLDENEREVYRRFCHRMPAALLEDLRQWALDSIDVEAAG